MILKKEVVGSTNDETVIDEDFQKSETERESMELVEETKYSQE